MTGNKIEPAQDTADREIVITRVLNAPRELVWKAWTDPKHLEQWWGPKGFTTAVTEMNLRPGGGWRYVMRGPDGAEYPCKGIFREITVPERIVTSDEFDEGHVAVGSGDLPSGMVVTAIFREQGDKTKLTLRIMHQSMEDRKKHEQMGVIAGWNSSFDCLDEHLAAERAQ